MVGVVVLLANILNQKSRFRDYERLKMTFGIYCIEHMESGKKYIGKSSNIEKRLNKHKWILTQPTFDLGYEKPNRYLWRAVQKYGWENFKTYILEELELDIKLLADREVYWMDFYNTLNRDFGYNLMRDSSSSIVMAEETRALISERNKGRVVSEQSRENYSKSKLAEKNPMYGVRGEQHHSFGKKFSDEFRKKTSEAHLMWSYEQRTKDGKFVKLWDSIHEIAKSGLFMPNKVRDVASGQKNRKSHKGFLWVAVHRPKKLDELSKVVKLYA